MRKEKEKDKSHCWAYSPSPRPTFPFSISARPSCESGAPTCGPWLVVSARAHRLADMWAVVLLSQLHALFVSPDRCQVGPPWQVVTHTEFDGARNHHRRGRQMVGAASVGVLLSAHGIQNPSILLRPISESNSRT
jgi:hypothetical protein